MNDSQQPKPKGKVTPSAVITSSATSVRRAPPPSLPAAIRGPWRSRERAQKAANIYWIVDNKQRWMEPLSAEDKARGFLGWHTRGYLPHFDAPGVTQFVTFRLADAMPRERRSEWEALSKIKDGREQRQRVEEYLDRGHGACHLRNSHIAELVRSCFFKFNYERYELHAWVVMPNHVHTLFTQLAPMAKIMESWKRYSSTQANKLLRRTGESFWQLDYFDTFMRDEEQFRRAKRYIEDNPVKAKLVRAPEYWPWSSASTERDAPTSRRTLDNKENSGKSSQPDRADASVASLSSGIPKSNATSVRRAPL